MPDESLTEGSDIPDEIVVERAAEASRIQAELLDRERAYTTVEHWQLRDVVDGRVRPEAMVLYLAIQAHGRAGSRCWPGNARLATVLGVQPRAVQRNMAQLVEHGWVRRTIRSTPHGTRRDLVCARQRLSSGDGGGVLPGRGGGGPVRHPEPPSGEPPGTSSLAGTLHLHPLGVDAGLAASPPTPSEAKAKKKPPEYPAWCRELAKELLAAYPHGLTKTGRIRKPSSTVVCRRLIPLLQPLEGDARAELATAILRAARAEAEAAKRDRAADPAEVHFTKGIEPWLNQRGWENPPEYAGPGSASSGSPVCDSFDRSVERAARERAAREAADPRPIRTEPVRTRPIEEVRAEYAAMAEKIRQRGDEDYQKRQAAKAAREQNPEGGAA